LLIAKHSLTSFLCYDYCVGGKRFIETRPLNPNPETHKRAINAAQGVIVAALRDQCCQWEQDSADLLASKVSGEFSALFGRALDARLNWSSTNRTVEKQCEPLVPCL